MLFRRPANNAFYDADEILRLAVGNAEECKSPYFKEKKRKREILTTKGDQTRLYMMLIVPANFPSANCYSSIPKRYVSVLFSANESSSRC